MEDKTGLGCGTAEGAAVIRPHMSVVSSCGCTVGKVDHVEGRGWYGLRRIAADLAESATTDDRVKDRLGGW